MPIPGCQPQRSRWAAADQDLFHKFPGESDGVAEHCRPAWDHCTRNFLQRCLCVPPLYPYPPRPDRCRHLLFAVRQSILQLAFCRTVKNKRVQLKHSQMAFHGAVKWFSTRLCSEGDLRSSVHSGSFCTFTLSPLQIHPATDLDRWVQGPSHWFISGLRP